MAQTVDIFWILYQILIYVPRHWLNIVVRFLCRYLACIFCRFWGGSNYDGKIYSKNGSIRETCLPPFVNKFIRHPKESFGRQFCKRRCCYYLCNACRQCHRGAQTISWPRSLCVCEYAFAFVCSIYVHVHVCCSAGWLDGWMAGKGKSFIKYSIILSLRMSGQNEHVVFCVWECCFFYFNCFSASSRCYFCYAFWKTTTRISIQRDICTHYLV